MRENGLVYFKVKRMYIERVLKNSGVLGGRKGNYSSFKLKYVLGETNGFDQTDQF